MKFITFPRSRHHAALALIVGRRFSSAFVTFPRSGMTAFTGLIGGLRIDPRTSIRPCTPLDIFGSGRRWLYAAPCTSADALHLSRFNTSPVERYIGKTKRRPLSVKPLMMSSMTGAREGEEICRAAHILCADKAAADAALDRVKAGENFGEIANDMSSCPSKEKGGDLGWFKKGQMVAEFEAACFENNAGTLVKVQTQFGWHVVAVLAKAVMPQQIMVEDLRDMLKTSSDGGDEEEREVQFVDVREEDELNKARIEGFINLPLSKFEEWSSKITGEGGILDPEKSVVVLCHHGMRSNQMAQHLATRLGFKKVLNVEGGIHAYATRVDPSVGVY